MKEAFMKRVFFFFLIIGLIHTQFAFASSDLEAEDQELLSELEVIELLESEDVAENDNISDKKDERESEDEIGANESVTDGEFFTDFIIDQNVEEDQDEDAFDDADTLENDSRNDSETSNLSLRDYNSNYYSDAVEAANYLDEKIDDYLNNNGSANIEIYLHFDSNENKEYKIRQITYFSKLYHAFCGYGNNLANSFTSQNTEQVGGVIYRKYIFNIESTLTEDEILDAYSIAITIANNANQYQSLDAKVSYVKNLIYGSFQYHHDCYDLIENGGSPSDGCDTAYSLCTEKAVCTGYTSAFCLVCYYAGWDAVPISGFVRQYGQFEGGGHAWNLIKDGSTWLQVDCTFGLGLFATDGASTRGLYNYFTDSFKESHEIDTTNSGWFQTTTGYTYIDQYGYPIARMWLHYPSYSCYFEKDACMAINRWLDIGYDRYYFLNNGHMATSTMILDEGCWRYLNGSGQIARSQWIQYNGYWYYFKENGYRAESEWIQDSTDWCYLGSDGKMVTSDWVQDSAGWCYVNSSGHITRSQWIQKNNYWYYLKSNGYRAQSEWIHDSTDWCYLGSDGKMVTSDWAQDSEGWCYLDSSGHLTRSQWLLKNNEWYYLKADGHMATNEWAHDSVGWGYMDSSGHITRSQWLLKNGYWYYLKADGHMATSEWIEDSIGWCYLGSDGKMVTNDWVQDSAGWCYMNSSGHKTRSAWIQNGGYWYYLKANGYRAESEWAQDSTGYCWMQSNGRWDSGTKWIGSPRYIGSSYILSGHRVDNQTIAIDGYNCTFNGIGKLISFVQITEPTPEPV